MTARGKQGGRGDKPGKAAQKKASGQWVHRGRGHPTLPAAERPWHKAYQRAEAAKDARRAARAKAKEAAPEVVAGRNPVLEALHAHVPAKALYVAVGIDFDDRVREALKIATDTGVPLLEVTRSELDRLTGGALHQGLALQIPPYEYAHPDDLVERARDAAEEPLIVALDGVTDPRNLGAVVRSAAAFGAHGVVVPERRAAGMTAGAWKASAGAAARLPVARATNLTQALKAYQKAGLMVVGLAADGAVDLADLELAVDPLVLVVGSEGRGLSRLVAQTCDLLVRIPIAAHTESLNAGVAAGIALYEVARRRAAAGRL
ncbi:23S rRNA (guanosine(2251)-2'-O)-methyltransferase RlmB [Carbonactinospora thermoautotrophica]|uniref:23S rRNA (Guanosine-2'-O-)-methyltransferase rlmB n=1 Tax=Carbonactinospora thermoautotrophica TaxID=1469144 RepID=A0A132MJK2_9ACTN|nr:23S rRNA (guanosine(2251)-2'-O)-methyltransferase RlmB [Carbonactinospora thermoautotrophica]KWW98040.1 RNA methyltransferase [Carbonactinospora thermoautotrophica]KWX03012.1 23S rRNA (guanosine-2'-O-) -methyltransferase rlmB [Carbonactinospora thermoautotrophica]MCX9193207.1 23S rRNA (guanosine(2251)-2'-O)-methyltransferase RlmB [Carbonactinospora thermoautotrophica]